MSDTDRRFVFIELLPGTHGLTIENAGFKKYEQTGISVTATERVTLPAIVLENFDMSLFKNFRLGSNEARRLQFRFETYNTFNHTQFNTIDLGTRFDANNRQTNTNYGYFTGAALARRLVLGLKLYFSNGMMDLFRLQADKSGFQSLFDEDAERHN